MQERSFYVVTDGTVALRAAGSPEEGVKAYRSIRDAGEFNDLIELFVYRPLFRDYVRMASRFKGAAHMDQELGGL